MGIAEAKGSDWARDPLKQNEENGYFHGRGTTDNKAGVTRLAAAFLQRQRQGFRPTSDLIIAFTGDEESNMQTFVVGDTKFAEF